MSVFNIKNQDIYVKQKGNSDKTIMFIHGNSLSSSLFRYQFEDENLYKSYRLIRFDLSGFGKSEFANDHETYYFSGFASIITGLIKLLKIKTAVLVGASLGGHLILESLEHLEGVKGIFLNGTPPFAIPPASDIFLPNPAIPLFYKENKTNNEREILAKVMVKAQMHMEDVKAELLKTDPSFIKHWKINLHSKIPSDEIEIVKNTNIPIAVLNGIFDPFVNLKYLQKVPFRNLWRNKIIKIQGVGHLPFLEQPLVYNKPLLTD